MRRVGNEKKGRRETGRGGEDEEERVRDSNGKYAGKESEREDR